jgi:hypothetical protein
MARIAEAGMKRAFQRYGPVAFTAMILGVGTVVVLNHDHAPASQPPEFVQTESMGAINVRLVDIPKLTTHYGTFLAPRYSFVEFAAPAGIERVVVTVGDCQCVSYPAAVQGGEMSTVPVRDGVFSIALSEKSWTPYIPRTRIEDLKEKRRAVRQ